MKKLLLKLVCCTTLLAGGFLMAANVTRTPGITVTDQEAATIKGGCCAGASVYAGCTILDCGAIIVTPPGGGCANVKPSGNVVYCCSVIGLDNVSNCNPGG